MLGNTHWSIRSEGASHLEFTLKYCNKKMCVCRCVCTHRERINDKTRVAKCLNLNHLENLSKGYTFILFLQLFICLKLFQSKMFKNKS